MPPPDPGLEERVPGHEHLARLPRKKRKRRTGRPARLVLHQTEAAPIREECVRVIPDRLLGEDRPVLGATPRTPDRRGRGGARPNDPGRGHSRRGVMQRGGQFLPRKRSQRAASPLSAGACADLPVRFRA